MDICVSSKGEGPEAGAFLAYFGISRKINKSEGKNWIKVGTVVRPRKVLDSIVRRMDFLLKVTGYSISHQGKTQIPSIRH